MTLNDRILSILSRRSSFEHAMEHAALLEACRHNGLLPELNEFDMALHALVDAGHLDPTWSRGGPGKMQAAYTATRPRATQTETPKQEEYFDGY